MQDRNDAGGGSRLLALQLNQRALGKVVVVQFGLHNVVYRRHLLRVVRGLDRGF